MSAGVAAAFAAHLVLAAGAGSLLFLLPHRVVEAVVAVLMAHRRKSRDGFAGGGAQLRPRRGGSWIIRRVSAEAGDQGRSARVAALAAEWSHRYPDVSGGWLRPTVEPARMRRR